MDLKLQKLETEFNKFVGKPLGMVESESSGQELVDGKLQEVKTIQIFPDYNDQTMKDMFSLAQTLGTQVFIEGSVSAGLGGTAITASVEKKTDGKYYIKSFKADYC